MDRDTYSNNDTAAYINQRLGTVKVGCSTPSVSGCTAAAASSRAKSTCGTPLTSFITPLDKLYFAARNLPDQHKKAKSSFREAADEALARFPDKSKIDDESFQLSVDK